MWPSVDKHVLIVWKEDCLKAKKEAEFEAFMQKNRVEIDEEVLKTVNHYGNK